MSEFIDPTKSKLGKKASVSAALHPEFFNMDARVAQVSQEKGYEPLNWLDPSNNVTVLKLLAAARRHEILAEMGFDDNSEANQDGSPCNTVATHLEHAAYNLKMASLLIKDVPQLDDRVFKNGLIKR